MVKHPSLDQVRRELDELRREKAYAAYWERHEFRSSLRRAMRSELQHDAITRWWSMRKFTQQRLIVGERILRGLYSPNSEVGNP